MSLKTLLMPVVSEYLTSPARLQRKRMRHERERIRRGEPIQVHYFHQVDDPYSALAAGVLPDMLARYDIEIVPHVVGVPPNSAAPDRERLVAWSRKDAHMLAQRYGLPFLDPGMQPSAAAVMRTTELLVASAERGYFTECAGPLSALLWHEPANVAAMQAWQGTSVPVMPAPPLATAAHVSAANALREHLGHYLGAMFFYGGEWYWGIDRLHHLETRLQELGARRDGETDLLFPPEPDLRDPPAAGALLRPVPPIDFFFSLRSPYSAVVTPRVFNLGRLTGAEVRLRFVLPMVMRGLPVTPEKRSYIGFDAVREARVRDIPFGRINDPLGRPTERGLALIPLAERAGAGQAYLLSIMRGIWAEGIDVGSDRGLRTVVERAGLPWKDAQAALKNDEWRLRAEENRSELLALGMWGVPSFKVQNDRDHLAVWGQDRLWAVENALRHRVATGRTE